MSKTLEELNVGTYYNMHIVNRIIFLSFSHRFRFRFRFRFQIEEETTIIEALNVFVKYRVSALPVVDKNRRLVNVYSKFDVIVSDSILKTCQMLILSLVVQSSGLSCG
jgi:hypothetical protein